MKSLILSSFVFAAVSVSLGVIPGSGAGPESAARPSDVQLTVSPEIVDIGSPASLAWTTHGVRARLTWMHAGNRRAGTHTLAGLPPSGTLAVYPEKDTIYTLECQTAAGQLCGTARVTVHVRPWLSTEKKSR